MAILTRFLFALLLLQGSMPALQTEPPSWPWPPKGADWPGAGTGGGWPRRTDFEYDPKINPPDPNDPVPNALTMEDLKEALELADIANPEAADEIRGAISNAAYGFYPIKPNKKRTGSHSKGGRRIDLVMCNRTPAEICGTMLHEWGHARGRNGYDDCVPGTGWDGQPKTHEEETAPCNHILRVRETITAYEIIAEKYRQEQLPPPIPCDAVTRIIRKCFRYYYACLVEGGTPPNCLALVSDCY